MKSTGEVMAIGRTFEESFLKAVRSLEIDRVGLDSLPATDDEIVRELKEPTSERIFSIAEALRRRGGPPQGTGAPGPGPVLLLEKTDPPPPGHRTCRAAAVPVRA